VAVESETPGLRERKRLRTRLTIARAALELFDRQGFDDTTIPQIAEAADVSPRTVSSYFPNKEDLAFPDSQEAIESLDSRLRERRPGETTADALRDWVRTWTREEAGNVEERRAQRRVIAGDDRLRAYQQRFTLQAQRAIAESIARDLGVSADDLEPRLAAAATIASLELVGEHLEPVALSEPGADPMLAVDRALLFIGAGIRALRGS
jgi:AcrR family transcriptional regulator